MFVSIIVEMSTRELTGSIPISGTVAHIIEEAESTLPEDQYEIIFVTDKDISISDLPQNCRFEVRPDCGYYGLKNAGAQVAKGNILVFWDSDSRPLKNYLRVALERLEGDDSLIGVTGISRYEGSSFLTRVNTALNFGFLYQGDHSLPPGCPMSHNLVIRKANFPTAPFGPYNGRRGGDVYIMHAASKSGKPIMLDSRLRMLHEDHSFSLIALLEQHTRDMMTTLIDRPQAGRLAVCAHTLWGFFLLQPKRIRRLFVYGPKTGLTAAELVCALPVLAVYAVIDAIAVTGLIVSRTMMERVMRFQFSRTL